MGHRDRRPGRPALAVPKEGRAVCRSRWRPRRVPRPPASLEGRGAARHGPVGASVRPLISSSPWPRRSKGWGAVSRRGEIGRRPVDSRPRSRQVPRQKRGLAISAREQLGVLSHNCSQRSHNQAGSICKTGAWARRKPVPASRPRLPSCPPRDERGAVSRASVGTSGKLDGNEEDALSVGTRPASRQLPTLSRNVTRCVKKMLFG